LRATVPRHVAIIMDGNGRWALEHNVPRAEGHRAGMEALRRVVRAAKARGVRYLTVYGFSTENWQRPSEEVDALMELLVEYLEREIDELDAEGVCLRAIGDLERLPPRCRELLLASCRKTAHNDGLDLILALSYGGRDEIVRAVRAIIRAGIPAEAVDEEVVSRHLDTAGIPDPDLLIRSGGVERLSNFLIWQTSYSEWYVTDVFWPDFDATEFDRALQAYAGRERTFGGRPAR
jgi:undecaprenyl diphosphate synthase